MKQKRYDFAAKHHVIDGLGIKIVFFSLILQDLYTFFCHHFEDNELYIYLYWCGISETSVQHNFFDI